MVTFNTKLSEDDIRRMTDAIKQDTQVTVFNSCRPDPAPTISIDSMDELREEIERLKREVVVLWKCLVEMNRN